MINGIFFIFILCLIGVDFNLVIFLDLFFFACYIVRSKFADWRPAISAAEPAIFIVMKGRAVFGCK